MTEILREDKKTGAGGQTRTGIFGVGGRNVLSSKLRPLQHSAWTDWKNDALAVDSRCHRADRVDIIERRERFQVPRSSQAG